MKKLLNIEWIKIRSNSTLLLVLAAYLLGTGFIIWLVGNFSSNSIEENVNFKKLGFYAPENLWQSVSYSAGFFKWIAAFFLIIFVSNEFTYKTLRQNIIDGLERKQVFLAKFLWVIILALLGVCATLLVGLVMGVKANEGIVLSELFQNTEYLFYLFMQLLLFYSLAFMAAVYLKRSGISMVMMVLYALIFEYLMAWGIRKISGIDFKLPLAAARELIEQPFARLTGLDELLQIEAKTGSMLPFVALVCAYTAVIIGAVYYKFMKSDL